MLRNPLSSARLFLTGAALLGLSLSLSSCADMNGSPWKTLSGNKTENDAPSKTPAQVPQMQATKVSILLPLSGKGAETGQAMLNAAQLALFDMNAPAQFELLPEDTGAGADKAIANAIANHAQLILGPLFSPDTKALSPTALQNGLNVISFSTDTSAAIGNTFLMGFMPQTQVESVLAHASTSGMKRIALIAPRDIYGDSVTTTFGLFMQRHALDNGGLIRYDAGRLPAASDLALLKSGVDAVLIATNGNDADKISTLLATSGYPAATVKRLGTGLWDQTETAKLSGLQGAWYAASSPRLRSRFEQRYVSTYGTVPPRLASLAYDATALSVVLAKSGKSFDRTTLTNPNGFAGIDGIFRFTSEGIAERGLAILEIKNGTSTVIQDAPQRF